MSEDAGIVSEYLSKVAHGGEVLTPEQAAAPCVTRIGSSNGKAFVVYLRDGTKITVGRDKTTKGPAWLEVQQQSKII